MSIDPYRPPFFLRNGHAQTVFAALLRRMPQVSYRREQIDTPDGDFLDLDWSCCGSERLAILSHGLEGHSGRAYMRGMARALNGAGIDSLAWNYRGCGGQPNRLLRMYHNGAYDDLHHVILHAAAAGRYRDIHLVGFSMGGNLTMLYLGKQAGQVPSCVKGAVGISVPCDLADAARQLDRRCNFIYMQGFLNSLHRKIRAKQAQFPEELNDAGYHRIKSFRQFDDRYTAPIHGFANASDYWRRCSCRPWLPGIRIPALLVNAMDDPFLAGRCYAVAECRQNPLVTLETPRNGGHVGFVAFNPAGRYWSEVRVLEFMASNRTIPDTGRDRDAGSIAGRCRG